MNRQDTALSYGYRLSNDIFLIGHNVVMNCFLSNALFISVCENTCKKSNICKGS